MDPYYTIIDGKWSKVYQKSRIDWRPHKKGKSKKRVQRDAKSTRNKKRLIQNKELIKKREKTEPSKCELQIMEFLAENDVKFEREVWSKKLFNPKTNYFLFFDFYLSEYNLAIEFDGIHHYKPIYGEEKLREQKIRDRMKDRFCKIYNVDLLRISCFQSKEIEMILCKKFDEMENELK